MLRTVDATRYVTPFREGGSLPALVEADDGETWRIALRWATGTQRFVSIAGSDV